MANDPVIVVRQPGRQELRLSLRSDLVVGRDCEGLLLADPEASRRHLELRVERGRVVCTDLESTNGTFVDGKRLDGSATVIGGVTITLGSTTMTIDAPSRTDGVGRVTIPIGTRGAHPGDLASARRTSIDLVAAEVTSERWRPGPVGETVTILFSDIEGSTERACSMGDEAWFDLLAAHNQVFRDELTSAGGREIKSQGDGFMVTFTSVRRAMGFAVAVQRRISAEFTDPAGGRLRVRMGLHTGEAMADAAGDLFGRHVIKAARIANLAEGAQILVSDTVREISHGSEGVSFGEGLGVELKGLPGLHVVHAVAWER